MATTKRKSRVLDEIRQTTQGLYRAGLISKLRLSEFEALCHPDVKEISPEKIKSGIYEERKRP